MFAVCVCGGGFVNGGCGIKFNFVAFGVAGFYKVFDYFARWRGGIVKNVFAVGGGFDDLED